MDIQNSLILNSGFNFSFEETMQKIGRYIGMGLFICLGTSALTAQGIPLPTPGVDTSAPVMGTVTRTPVANPESTTENPTQDEASSADEEEKPFVPHWSGQVGYTYSNQPSAAGQGQIQNQVGLTGTYNLTESGHYVALGIIGGEQLVNQANTNFGEITLEGGLGFDFFNPALELTTQQGAAALNSYGSVLTLDFKPWDVLTIGLIGGGGTQNHQGPPPTQSTDKIDEVDEYNYNGEFQVSVETADYLTLSLTAEDEWDTTYQWQNVTHTAVHALKNETDQMPSLTLGIDSNITKNYEVELDLQGGREYEPAGLFYSPKQAKYVFNLKPTEQNFSGISLTLNYNFE
jgi:hypothetical protein